MSRRPGHRFNTTPQRTKPSQPRGPASPSTWPDRSQPRSRRRSRSREQPSVRTCAPSPPGQPCPGQRPLPCRGPCWSPRNSWRPCSSVRWKWCRPLHLSCSSLLLCSRFGFEPAYQNPPIGGNRRRPLTEPRKESYQPGNHEVITHKRKNLKTYHIWPRPPQCRHPALATGHRGDEQLYITFCRRGNESACSHQFTVGTNVCGPESDHGCCHICPRGVLKHTCETERWRQRAGFRIVRRADFH